MSRPALRFASSILTHVLGVALALSAASCASRPEVRPTVVESEFLQPRVDEAAHRAVRCIREEPERMVEISVEPNGAARAVVHPFPAAPQQQLCADAAAVDVHAQPAPKWTRSFARGDGRLGDPAGLRERGLTLRSRATEQHGAVELCRQAWLSRRPAAEARVGLLIEVDEEGSVRRVDVAAATPNLDEGARACVVAAARALKLPPIPGIYRYSYLLAPRGMLVGAPDVDAIDAFDSARAIAEVAPARDACLAMFHLPGQLLVHLSVGNHGAPIAVTIERPATSSEDVDADACLRRAMMAVRVPPFDGPPASLTVPLNLR